MRTVYFLVPGTTGKFRCGGLLVELQTARLLRQITPVEVVTYSQRETGFLFLDDLLTSERGHQGLSAKKSLWIISWGFDVRRLLKRLRGRAVAYHAHSVGYRLQLPPGIPVLAVSRNTLGYWASRAARNPLFLVPNALEGCWIQQGNRQYSTRRPIDVLVQQRKTSNYVLRRLVPALRSKGLIVEVQSGWVDDLVNLFNSSTVYIYDSADYWNGQGLTEGFGLPPIEALACGCVVFSSFNHALADWLEPGITAHQIGFGTLEADVERIAEACRNPQAMAAPSSLREEILADLSEDNLLDRWERVLKEVDLYYSHRETAQPEALLVSSSSSHLFAEQSLGRLRRWLLRKVRTVKRP